MAGLLDLLLQQRQAEVPQYAQAGTPSGLLGQAPVQPPPEITIQGQTYEAIPPDQFNHNLYDRLELYHGRGARPNPPTYLLGNDPADPDQSPKGIKYWRRKAAPFASS